MAESSGSQQTRSVEGRRKELIAVTMHLERLCRKMMNYRDTAAAWLLKVPDHRFTRTLREDIDGFVTQVTMEMSRLEQLQSVPSSRPSLDRYEKVMGQEPAKMDKGLPKLEQQ